MFGMKKSFERINGQQVATKGYVFVRSSTSSSLWTGAERKLEEDPVPLPGSSTELLPAGSPACLPCLLLSGGKKGTKNQHLLFIFHQETPLLPSHTVTLKAISNPLHVEVISPLILALQRLK